MNDPNPVNGSAVALEEIVVTQELARRTARSPDLAAENRALAALARELSTKPEKVLQSIADSVLEICGTDSAGVSILEAGEETGSEVFRWHATAGIVARSAGAIVPRDGTPCGVVLDQDATVLIDRPGRYFGAFESIDPPCVEGLWVPFHVDGRPVGAIWALGHTPDRRFDAEDARVLSSFSAFASAAYQARALSDAHEAIRREADGRAQAQRAVRDSEQRLRQIIDALPVAIYTTDAEGRLTHFNPAAVEFSGRTPQLGTDRWCVSWNLYYPDGRPMPHDECPMAMALREGRPLQGAAVAERPDGKRIPFEAHPAPFLDADGAVVGAINMLVDTTERQRAEKELRETKEDLSDFVENASVAMHWVGADGTILWANRAELDMLGYSHEEYIGRHIAEFHADSAAIKDILNRLTAAETLHEYPSRLRCRDGSTRDVLINSNVRWQDGEFVHTRCFTRDITERNKGEEARARLAAVVESTDDAIITQDLDGIITTWNFGAERLLGYTADQVVGGPITKIIPPERRGEETETRERIGRGEPTPHYETVRRRQDGTLVDVSLTTSPIVDVQGRVVGASKIARDITQRKRTERLLSEQSRLLEMIASGAPLDQCLESLCAIVPQLSAGARASISLADEQRQTFSRVIVPDLLSSFGQGIAGAVIRDVIGGGAVFLGEPVSSADIANDDRWSNSWRKWCIDHDVRACHSEPVFGVGGRAVASFMLCFDQPRAPSDWERHLAAFGAHLASIALERDRAGRALRESEQRLREMNRSLERRVDERTQRLRHLAAELATAETRERKRIAALLHDDLQQLLVAARLQLVRVRADSSETADAIGNADQLLEDALSEGRSLTQQLRPPVLYEDGLVAALAWLASEMQRRHGLNVAVDCPDSELPLSEDARAFLFESTRELLFNVVKYASVDDAAVEIRTGGEHLWLRVRDSGCGFDIGAVSKTGRDEGFGLFSLRERLAALGGELAIESVVGCGTCIELRVPMASVSGGPDRASNESRSPTIDANETSANRPRVLIVDDHAIVRQGIANILDSDDRLVVAGEAGDGVEALDTMEHARPDVVLMDVNMPVKNGLEATREIRRRWPGTAIIGLSVQGDEATARSMQDAGAVAFVAKSGGREEMIAAILGAVNAGRE